RAVASGGDRKASDQPAPSVADRKLGDLQRAVGEEGREHAPLVEDTQSRRVQVIAASAVHLAADLLEQNRPNPAAAERVAQRGACYRRPDDDDIEVHRPTIAGRGYVMF